MNGKVAKRLRKMGRTSKDDKRIWNELTRYQRGLISTAFRNNDKLMHLDFLPRREDSL